MPGNGDCVVWLFLRAGFLDGTLLRKGVALMDLRGWWRRGGTRAGLVYGFSGCCSLELRLHPGKAVRIGFNFTMRIQPGIPLKQMKIN